MRPLPSFKRISLNLNVELFQFSTGAQAIVEALVNKCLFVAKGAQEFIGSTLFAPVYPWSPP